MKSSFEHESASARFAGVGKAYSAPGLRRLNPDAAREMLQREPDINDPEIKFMLDCVERLRDAKGS